jgi:hypothetical protein
MSALQPKTLDAPHTVRPLEGLSLGVLSVQDVRGLLRGMVCGIIEIILLEHSPSPIAQIFYESR